jgi:hypothetical protein
MSYHLEDAQEVNSSISAVESNSSFEKIYQVSVFSSDSGNKYQFDTSGTVAEIIGLKKGSTYKFDQSDSSNINHPLSFSITSNGTHGGGQEIEGIVQKYGTPGNDGAYTLVTPTASSLDLYYYCTNHSGMGGKARITELINSNTNETFESDGSSSVFAAIGNYTNFTLSNLEDDKWSISASSIGNDSITGFKRIEFNDGVLALDIDAGDTAGQAYRLYQAAFARTPDMTGVSYHMNDMEANGLALENIANNFIASPEFITKYGESPSDDVFINLLYQNVLSRTPADSEVSWYQNQFDTGSMSRAAALIGFAESPENVALVSPQIDDGIWLAS